MALILKRAEVDSTAVDVRIDGGIVTDVVIDITPAPGDDVVEANCGWLLPGLHDHHLHLMALATALVSVRCGPPDVTTASALAGTLRDAVQNLPRDGWIRGIGYHESVAGSLDRDSLDRFIGAVPVRVQHRSGSLWICNSAAVERLSLERTDDAGIERDANGRATGRLWRADALLRGRLDYAPPDLAAVGKLLARCGVTGVTDATYTNDARSISSFASAQVTGALPQRVRVMGPANLSFEPSERLQLGEVKLMLDDDTLPALDELSDRIRNAHTIGRSVAVHCVTAVQLLLALAGFEEAGVRGDRIEHASIVPDNIPEVLKRLGLRVVTQPGFVAERGDQYRLDVDRTDLGDLYPIRRLQTAGVPVAASTDAPYTSPDPWAAMRAAADRRSHDGVVLTPNERVAPETAVDLFLSSLADVGSAPRRISPGTPADLALLAVPRCAALRRLDANDVAMTIVGGEIVHDAR